MFVPSDGACFTLKFSQLFPRSLEITPVSFAHALHEVAFAPSKLHIPFILKCFQYSGCEPLLSYWKIESGFMPVLDLILRGVITLQGFNKLKIPTRRSCLTIQLRELYTCIEKLGCRKPFVSEKRIEFRDGIPVKDGNQIIYEAQFTAVLGRKYKVTGILNLGWCKDFVKGNRKTRLSDFITTGALIISPKHGKVASADLLMSLVQPYHGKKEAL